MFHLKNRKGNNMKPIMLFLFVIIFEHNIFPQTPQWELLGLENEGINDIAIDDSGNVYVATLSGLFKSTDDGDNWINIKNGLGNLNCVKLFINTSGTIFLASSGGLFKSDDGGYIWVRIADSLSSQSFLDVTIIPNGFIYTSNSNGIYRSTNSGNTWHSTNYTDPCARSITINKNGYMFFGNPCASWFGIYRSTDLGLTWIRQTLLSVELSLIALRDGSLLAGCYNTETGFNGIYKTVDNGNIWFNTNTFSGLMGYTEFVLDNNNDVYVSIGGQSRGVHLSTNNGISWNNYGLSESEYGISSLAIDSSGYIWAGTNFNGIYRTKGRTVPVELISLNAEHKNDAIVISWITASEINNKGFEIERKSIDWEKVGFVEGYGTTTETKSYSFNDENIQSGTYQYRLKQIDFDGSFEYSNIIRITIDQSKNFNLFQNYPNPFNPKTIIKFSIDKNAIVSMDLYSILGEKITTIIQNKRYNPGVYEIEFESKDIPSGIYLYELKANGKSAINKLTIIK